MLQLEPSAVIFNFFYKCDAGGVAAYPKFMVFALIWGNLGFYKNAYRIISIGYEQLVVRRLFVVPKS
ncbi:MAG: hypothetical protein WAW31_10605, partial [Smithella sp.]